MDMNHQLTINYIISIDHHHTIIHRHQPPIAVIVAHNCWSLSLWFSVLKHHWSPSITTGHCSRSTSEPGSGRWASSPPCTVRRSWHRVTKVSVDTRWSHGFRTAEWSSLPARFHMLGAELSAHEPMKWLPVGLISRFCFTNGFHREVPSNEASAIASTMDDVTGADQL